MRRIRIKKDISVVWRITTNGQSTSLAGRDLSLVLLDPKHKKTSLSFTIEGNALHFRVGHDLQSFIGVYAFELWENLGENNQTVVDRTSAFELVSRTTQEDNGTADDIAAATADLGTASLAVGVKGDKGDKGDQGDPGSDANVTEENIILALGYTPADNADLEDFQTELAGCVKSDGTDTISISRTNSVISMGNGFNILTSGNSRLDLLRDENSARLQGGVVRLTSTTPTGVIKNELQLSNDSLLLRERTTGKWVNKTVATTDQIPTDYVKNEAEDEGDIIINGGSQIVLQADEGSAGLALVEGGAVQLNGSSITANNKPIATTDQLEEISTEITDFLKVDSVKDNGNIVLTDKSGNKKEYMAATPSGDPMHYAYVDGGAVWNESTGFWELNGLTDITNAQMRPIYRAYCKSLAEAAYCADINGIGLNMYPRTNLHYPSYLFDNVISAVNLFRKNNDIEIVDFYGGQDRTFRCGSLNGLCLSAANLRRFETVIQADTTYAYNPFFGCKNLEYVKIKGLRVSISFNDSPNLLAECVAYTINNVYASATNVVITLHATAYARAMADVDVTAALAAHTNVSLASA